jgi:hypothetical protein
MARGSRRSSLTGSAFIRLLAALNDVHVPASKDAFAERLSRWFDWTDAISLSAALNCPPEPAPDVDSGAALSGSADEREYSRVRTALTKVAAAPAAATDPGRSMRPASAPSADPEAAGDFSPHRRHYVASQQAMEANIAPLRRRVRATLAGASPALAKLAAMDAVMEQVVGARERALLATVPRWLEQHFDRLGRDHRETPVDTPAPDVPPTPGKPAGWQDMFCQDVRGVLLAELDLRLQPVEGLLEALRRASPDSP